MRNFINIVNNSVESAKTLNEGVEAPNKFIRLQSVIDRIALADPSTEDGATTLLQRLNYLCDAVTEFCDRGGDSESCQAIRKAVGEAKTMFPKDGDIEGVMSNPHTKRNIADGIALIRSALKSYGVMVEAAK